MSVTNKDKLSHNGFDKDIKQNRGIAIILNILTTSLIYHI